MAKRDLLSRSPFIHWPRAIDRPIDLNTFTPWWRLNIGSPIFGGKSFFRVRFALFISLYVIREIMLNKSYIGYSKYYDKTRQGIKKILIKLTDQNKKIYE